MGGKKSKAINREVSDHKICMSLVESKHLGLYIGVIT